MTRVVLLTSAERRHRFAARGLAALELVGVVAEAKRPDARPVVGAPAGEDERLVNEHFAGRDAAEARLLGEARWPDDVPRYEVPSGGINASETVDWVRDRRPDVLILYGTGIVRPPLLDLYAGRIINLHLGLSPYYRGSGTNLWPLVDRRPECVGATLHLAVREVDAGPVLVQVRPPAESDDDAHTLGTKTLQAAVGVLPAVLGAWAAGRLVPSPQDPMVGRVFRRRDFSAAAVRRLREQLATGMIPEYLANKESRDRAYPIVEAPWDVAPVEEAR